MPQCLRRVIALLICFVFALNMAGLPKAEAFSLISTKQEVAIGRDVAQQLEKQYGLVEDRELQERVNRIGQSMVAVSDRKSLTYSFKVLNSKEVNALAAPGGYVYVFQGLVDLMPSDDELAGVIGHEIGHITERHTVKQMEKSLGMGILFGAVFGSNGVLLQNLALNAIMAGYSRDDERESDKLGFLHSYKAGYNPYSMVMGLQKLSELNQKYQQNLFSDHPEGRARVALVKKYMDEAKIRPQVVLLEEGNSAQILDGEWKLPPITATFDGYKPLLRAYFAAGTLYRLSQLADYSDDKFITESDGTNCTIYYDDQKVITLTPDDAAASGTSVMDFAGSYIAKIKEWK
ncbi:Beta-barrel assembly-enhancing protease [bioreactor metagenome]|uniref:Beta-barrel assembly-enhancing protease n=1 Tax=bioreactor metagenome TaxID=1076179 RepID=A0A644TSM7_9ZZZZ|nr:M48 family metalloprotease [Negativicutes bacterium]